MRHNPLVPLLPALLALGVAAPSLADDAAASGLPIPPAYQPLFEEGRTWTFQITETITRDAGLPPVRRTFHQICRVARTWQTPKLRAARIECVTDGAPWRDDALFTPLVIATPEGLLLGNPRDPYRDDPPKTLPEIQAFAEGMTGLLAPIPARAVHEMSPPGGNAAWPARLKTPAGVRGGWCAKIQDNNDGLFLQWCLAPGVGPVSGAFAITSLDVTDPDDAEPGVAFYRYRSRLLATHPPP